MDEMEYIKENNVDVILIHIEMPKNIFEFKSELREWELDNLV